MQIKYYVITMVYACLYAHVCPGGCSRGGEEEEREVSSGIGLDKVHLERK